MKKHNILLGCALLAPLAMNAQQTEILVFENEPSLVETVAKIEKKTDKFNLYFNMHGDAEANWDGDEFQNAHFQMKQFRLEAKGNITDWLSYRYRQRFTKTQEPQATDNLAAAIDIAGIGLNFGKFGMFLGKQCAAYGGIEFDLNPIEIYQYSDMIDNMSNFLTGVNFSFNFTPKQQLQFQVLDALNGTSVAMYGNYRPYKLPLVYTLNWNGNNFGGVWNTRYSVSYMSECKDLQMKNKGMYYFALGNDFKITDRFGAYLDWMYSLEGVDRKGIMTSMVKPAGGDLNATDVVYNSLVAHLNYFVAPKWNVFGKFMYETAGFYKNQTINFGGEASSDPVKVDKGVYRTSLGWVTGVEFYPLKDRNLHFFLTYVGRHYSMSNKGKAMGLVAPNNSTRISVGFIWQMPVF